MESNYDYEVRYIVSVFVDADSKKEAKKEADVIAEVEFCGNEHEFHSIGKPGFI